jgi:hypothetical protein
MKARLQVEFHPEAVAEALAARDWYAAREASLGAAFVQEVEQAVRRIEDAPTRWPPLDRETRRVVAPVSVPVDLPRVAVRDPSAGCRAHASSPALLAQASSLVSR